jgi:hypothetical protein
MAAPHETHERAHAAPASRPPYAAYAGIMGTFLGALGAAGVLARSLGRDPPGDTALELAVLSVATFKTARTISRDGVMSFVRAPFVEGEAGTGQEEVPVGSGGFQQAIGELVTCSRCVGTWAAAGLATTQIVAPRFGRLLTWSLAAAGTNDFLQAGFAALTSKTNELQERSGSSPG